MAASISERNAAPLAGERGEGGIAVLDIGKTNVKLVVTGADGAALFSRTAPNPVRTDGPYAHHDTDRIWAFFQDALADASTRIPIGVIVPTAHGGSCTLLGDDGLALPMLDYDHAAIHDCDAAYDPLRDPFADTLSPWLPAGLNVGRQVFWQQQCFPDAFARARWLLTYPQYWTWLLTGVAVNEVTSLGAHTDLWLPRQRRPAPMVARLGWSALLPPVRPAWESPGPLKPEIARRLGIAPDARVLTGIHDSNASLLPYLGSLAKPFTVISTGTWVIGLGAGAPLDGLVEAADTLANVDATGQPVASFRFVGGREYAALASEVPGTEAALARIIDAGTQAIPGFSATGGPFAAHPGRIVGPPPDGPEAQSALATLYVALMTDHGLDYLRADQGPIIIEGSFVQNPLFAAVLAALRPWQPVLVSSDTTGTAGGAARLAIWPRAASLPKLPRAAPSSVAGLHRHRGAWRAALPGIA